MKAVKQKLLAYGLGGALALGGTYLIIPQEGQVKKDGWHVTYIDAVGVETACYGQTGKDIKLGQKYSDEECLEMLSEELVEIDNKLNKVFKVKYQNDYQRAALVSFAYNVGVGNVQTSTLARLFNQGKYQQACNELSKWVYAKKKKLKGLVTRREVERQWCLGNPPKEVREEHETKDH
ncbi:Lysozyme RrrD [compost metagenome]